MIDIDLSDSELKVLEFFFKSKCLKALSPKEIDDQLEFGLVKVIDLFLDLELKEFIKWVTLDLIELELGRSTTEIYEEVYNSTALLTKQGQNFMENYKPGQLAT